MSKITGYLDAFFETGTEGIVWSITDDAKEGYNSLVPLHLMDHLTIYSPTTGELVWSGNIDLDYKQNLTSIESNPAYHQQSIDGYWVHGIQRDIDPVTWLTWFQKSYPCELVVSGLGKFYQIYNSSMIDSYYYTGEYLWADENNASIGDLFLNMNGSVYKYLDIPNNIVRDFVDATSHGRYFATHIRDKFVTEKFELPKL